MKKKNHSFWSWSQFFSMLITLIAGLFGMGGVMMAAGTVDSGLSGSENVGSAHSAAVAGQNLNGTQMPGEATTVTSVSDATGGIGGDNLIQPDIDEEIVKIATDEAVLNTIKHRCKRKVKVNAFEVDHYLIDEPKFKTVATAAVASAADKKVNLSLAGKIASTDYGMFYVGQTVCFPGIDGYQEDGTTAEAELVAIVTGMDSNDAPIIRPINGKKDASTDANSYFPDVASGTTLLCLDTAAYETQKFIQPSTMVPVKERLYLQKRLVNSIVSDYFDAQKKRIPFAQATIAEAILRKWRLENCRGDWRNVKRKFYVKANDPTLGGQLAYTAQGLRWQFRREYTLAGKLTMADLIALCKFKFTGFDCSKTALWLMGRDLLADIQSLDMTLHKDISMVSSEAYGIKCTKIVTIFGEIQLMHDPTLDKLGWSHCGALLDEKGLVRYYNKNEQSSNEKVEGEEATREIVMTIDCLALKGFSHIWVDGSGITSVNTNAVKVKPCGAASDLTGASTGDIFILTTTVSVSINNATAANQTAGTVIYKDSSGYWQYYTGDVYATA